MTLSLLWLITQGGMGGMGGDQGNMGGGMGGQQGGGFGSGGALSQVPKPHCCMVNIHLLTLCCFRSACSVMRSTAYLSTYKWHGMPTGRTQHVWCAQRRLDVRCAKVVL